MKSNSCTGELSQPMYPGREPIDLLSYKSEIKFRHALDFPWLSEYWMQKFPIYDLDFIQRNLSSSKFGNIKNIQERNQKVADSIDALIDREIGLNQLPYNFFPNFSGIIGEIAAKKLLEEILKPITEQPNPLIKTIQIRYSDFYMDSGVLTGDFKRDNISANDLIVQVEFSTMMKKVCKDFVFKNGCLYLFIDPSLHKKAEICIHRNVLKIPLINENLLKQSHGINPGEILKDMIEDPQIDIIDILKRRGIYRILKTSMQETLRYVFEHTDQDTAWWFFTMLISDDMNRFEN